LIMIRSHSTAFLRISCIIVHFICCSCTPTQNKSSFDDTGYQKATPQEGAEFLKQFPNYEEGLITRGINQGKGAIR
ncbi:MAG: hypothetical protein Q4C03_02995, partial [bacterium]|nr:hypothetical protein [bacterium]